ncbi:MAG: acetamidase/formamidase family protein [Deltaproteobacteria bacterium]|jgi:acetamidase/formamidase|nr:acetamidase/formamidase family protein [Deltaproteobacteria bacterium]
MPIKPDYTIDGDKCHYGWDRSIEPVVRVDPGSVLEIEAVDAGGGQITADSTLEDVKNIDFGKVNPVTGPVYVAGAEPGDALKVTIVSLRASGWGWSAVIPGFGLLADQFEDPALYIWQYDPETLAPAPYLKGAKVPLKPFPGTIGVAPAPQGQHSVVNPRKVGGNMDTRDLSAGAVLYLPVEVPGALFSLGDAHAAQGDGEVCGTAIESPMQVTVKLEVAKGMNLRFPRFTTPGPVSRHFDKNGYEVTTGIGSDLMESARAAVSDMVDLVADRHGYSRAEAYMLCSVCADLRISEIVDAPDWIVSFYFPKIVFA